MRMIEIDYEAQPPIDGYGPGGFRIGGNWHDGSILLMPQGLLPIPHQLSVGTLTPLLEAAHRCRVGRSPASLGSRSCA